MRKNSLQLFGMGRISETPDWFMPPHCHPTHHELIVVLDGSMLLRTREGEITAQRGDLLFYHAGLTHEEIASSKIPLHTIFMVFGGHIAALNLPIRLKDADGRVREMVGWLLRDQISTGSSRNHQSLFRAVLEELSRLNASRPDPWVQDIRNYLNENFPEALSLEKIARQTGMTRFAFIRKYRRLSGNTPMQELRQIRLNEARRLILSSGEPLKRIASAVGLGDEYQLSKLFRKHFRLSPSELRSRQTSRDSLL